MKKLAVKKFPEKLMMAAVILSCGFVLHAEPPATKGKQVAAPHPTHKARNLHASMRPAAPVRAITDDRHNSAPGSDPVTFRD